MNKEINPAVAWFLIIVAILVAFFYIESQIKALNKDIDAISSTQAVIRAPGQIGTGISTGTPATLPLSN